MIITISGPAGSGKSTVSKIVAKKLGMKHYSVGEFRRQMAKRMGITLAELNKLGESQDFTDREADKFQEELGKKEDNFVIDGRTSFHFIPHSIKVHLTADPMVRAERVFKDEKRMEKFGGLADAVREVLERDASDRKRYEKYYGLDVADEMHYDLVVDTSRITSEQAADRIISFVKNRG